MKIVVRPANGYSFPVLTNELFTTIESAIKVNGNAIMSIGGVSLGVAPTEIQIFYQFTPETHVYNAVKQDGKAAGCTENGWNEYYACECGKFFIDSDCTTEIADLNAWKDGDGKIPAAHTSTEFTYTTNNDGTHTKKHACCGTLVGNENCSGGSATCTTKATCEKCNTAYGDFGAHDFTGVTLTEEIPATCVATGTRAHKDCSVCDTYFTSEKVATTEAELVIPAPTHTPRADDGDCTTDILCTGCDKVMTEGADAHADTDTNGKCDTCGKDMPTTPGGDEPGTDEPGTDTPGIDDPNTGNIDEPKDDEDGLGTGAIAGIVVGSVAVLGLGGFALYWFVFRKKRA